ncbi:MAG: hypothetical protein DRJ63_08615 [Thermoprotei archaeon]|nr:MAG: hypothetical protein DRJ63_08615 [Thermoprotei archaeon]
MAKLSSKKTSQTHRCIIYGAPKTGKSLIAGKLAEHYNLIWFDLENGHETLFQLPEAWQERIELINLPDTRSYPIAIETVLKAVKGKVTICEEHGKVSCMLCKKLGEEKAPVVTVDLPALGHESVVVFDSLTQLSNSAISFITKNQPDDYKLCFDDWGNLGKLLDIFLSHIQQAGYNVIVISHETEAETEGKKKTLVPVGGTRNFSRNIAKYFDHVIYAERKNRKHVFSSSTTYATTILTGSRTGVAIEEGEEPSLLAIFKPELFAKAKAKAKVAGAAGAGVPIQKATSTSAAKASSILNRLKKK